MKKIAMLLLLVIPAALRADVVETLYEARVPVTERGASTLKSAAAEGLNQVLVRVSGRRDIGGAGAVRRALGNAQGMLQQYNYRSEWVDGREQLFLEMSFGEAEVNRLLSQSGLPVWDKNRPQTLVWLVVDDVKGRQFVSEASHPEIVNALREAAGLRGLPVIFPAMDIDDRLQLSTAQVWSMNLEAVREAAQRYRSSQILTGRLTRLSQSWLANLAHVAPRDEDFIDHQASDLVSVVGPAVDAVADELASRFAVVGGAQGGEQQNIRVSGIDSFRDYARLLTYLESVAVIEHANPLWVAGSQVIIQLHLQGDMEKARQFFQLDKKIEEERNPMVSATESSVPTAQLQGYYRWRN